jgi:hypothetical protein
LVKQLGHARFSVREAAGKRLIEMGRAAVQALKAGAKSDDEEVRSRSAILLPQAEAADRRQRLDAYLADPDGRRKHDLPLLSEWTTLVKSADAGSRQLFAEMFRANGELMDLAAADSKEGVPAVRAHSRELLESSRSNPVIRRDGQKELPLGKIASTLFLQSIFDRDLPTDDRVRAHPCHLLYNPSSLKAVTDKEVGRAFRLLVSDWAKSRPLGDSAAAGSFTDWAIRQPVPEAVPQLARLVNHFRGGTLGAQALAGIERAASDGAKAVLSGMLSDSSQMWMKAGENDVRPQLRDCALASLARLSGRAPEDFGLTAGARWDVDFGGPGGRATVQLYGFATGDEREKGLNKWKELSRKK